VGPRAGLDTEVRGKFLLPLPGIEPRSPGRPARSQTLYCLSYPAHTLGVIATIPPKNKLNELCNGGVLLYLRYGLNS
jgi:hypothetical protein